MAIIITPVTTTTIKQHFFDTSDDLLYNILIALGGTLADIKELYNDRTDDILYAILLKLGGSVIIVGGGGGVPVPEFVNTLSMQSATYQVIDIGTAPGLDDIASAVELFPDTWNDQAIMKSNDTGTIYYISGNADPLTLKIRI